MRKFKKNYKINNPLKGKKFDFIGKKINLKGRKFPYIVIGIMILLLVIAMFSTKDDRDNLSTAESALRESASPISRFVGGIGDKISSIGVGFKDKKDLMAENENLHRMNNKLRFQVSNYLEIEKENQRLKELLNYATKNLNGWNYKTGQVIGREIDNWDKALLIDIGSKEGVKKNMAVVGGSGLIGRVSNVTDNTAEIVLLLNKGLSIGGVLENSRTPGIIEGYGNGKDLLRMKYLPYEQAITVGEVVVTTGKGGIFPKNIRIGQVVKVMEATNGLSKEAIIEPFTDFNRIEEVLVMIGEK